MQIDVRMYEAQEARLALRTEVIVATVKFEVE